MPRITEDGYFAIPLSTDNITVGTECLKCGCLVQTKAPTAMEMHKEWHLQMDELIDWARAVSQIFVPKEAPDGETPSS